MKPILNIDEEKKVDISETWLWEKYPTTFAMLLLDHTTGENIYWATDPYEALGDRYRFHDSIVPEAIIGEKGKIIQPRALKSREEQTRQSKDKERYLLRLRLAMPRTTWSRRWCAHLHPKERGWQKYLY